MTADYWYYGLGMLYGQLIAHHLLFYAESNSFNAFYILMAFICLCTWPFNIWLNDATPGTWYYKNQWLIV